MTKSMLSFIFIKAYIVVRKMAEAGRENVRSTNLGKNKRINYIPSY